MTDVIKEAQELVEKYDGKITEGKWYSIEDPSSYCLRIRQGGEIYEWASDTTTATETDIEAMASVPEMVSVIKGLLSVIEEQQVEDGVFEQGGE